MSDITHGARETLDKSHRVFERLADVLDRSRVRPPGEMRALIADALKVLEPALKSHVALETALAGALTAGSPGLAEGLRVTAFQHDAIASLIKDLRIIIAEPGGYRAEHLATLTFQLSRNLREHLRYEEKVLWSSLPEGGAPAAAFEDLRRLETMLGRL